MKKDYIKKNLLILITFALLFLAIFLRFYAYNNRWGLAYDQAHDALVAREALRQHKLPILGPFSSAGPFVTGPQWYWFIILGTLIYSSAVITPWVVLTFIFILVVYLMIQIGKEINGSFLAISAGVLTAVSSSEIAQSTNLTNQAPLVILSALSVYSVVKYFKCKNIWFLFLNGLVISLGINTHLQGVLMLPMLAAPLVLDFVDPFLHFSDNTSRKIDYFRLLKEIVFSCIGFVIPFIPLIVFDTTHHFYDLGHMWQYYRYDQYKISLDLLGRNWKTYLGNFWPQSLAYITGGYVICAYLLIAISIAALGYHAYKKSIPKPIIAVAAALFIGIVVMRYTRTPLFASYLMFLHPWIFILVAWAINAVHNKNKILAYLILTVTVVGSLIVDSNDISPAVNRTAMQTISWEGLLSRKFPNQKFALYDYDYRTTANSVPLSLFLDVNKKIDDNGVKIGFRVATQGAQIVFPTIYGKREFLQLFVLTGSTSAELKKSGWTPVNPSYLYHSSQEWFQDKNL